MNPKMPVRTVLRVQRKYKYDFSRCVQNILDTENQKKSRDGTIELNRSMAGSIWSKIMKR